MSLSSRFTDEVLNSPKSFTRRSFQSLDNQYNVLLTLLRESTPSQSPLESPFTGSRRGSGQGAHQQPAAPAEQQHYWNEYDNGSEAGDVSEPYTIYIDPDAEPIFPGVKTVVYVFSWLSSGVKTPIEKLMSLMSPQSDAEERRPLIQDRNGGYLGTGNSPTIGEADFDDDASSSDFPGGYVAHYATLPSIKDQRLSRNRERILVGVTIGSLAAALLLIFVAGLLVTTGRHRLRVEVDAGVIVGIVSSLLFAALGFTTMVYRWARVGWLHKISVTMCFITTCILSGALLVLIMGNTRLP
jgi:hypothetical protein